MIECVCTQVGLQSEPKFIGVYKEKTKEYFIISYFEF